jgi:DNA-binding HxlR family transcriptional regulator
MRIAFEFDRQIRGCFFPPIMAAVKKQRDLPVTIYRILLYLSRMRSEDHDFRRLVRIERATGIDRKELRDHLQRLTEVGLIERIDEGSVGRGGHQLVHWDISPMGRSWRSDIGRFIQLAQRAEYYPESFFYLPSDAI